MEATRAAHGTDTEATEDREDIEDQFETGINGSNEEAAEGFPSQDDNTLINIE